jgi:hypothetical protein
MASVVTPEEDARRFGGGHDRVENEKEEMPLPAQDHSTEPMMRGRMSGAMAWRREMHGETFSRGVRRTGLKSRSPTFTPTAVTAPWVNRSRFCLYEAPFSLGEAEYKQCNCAAFGTFYARTPSYSRREGRAQT